MMPDPEDRAPIFGSWTPWYILVIGVLLLLIVLFDRFTQLFTR